ncbi:MAG: acetate--CoA ligase family protein [Rickettsiaceae bacterium]|nr:acetate--CoA ligase family protein [Rickettsiaceae bacterium]
MKNHIKRIFNPKSVALIGASKRSHSVGAVIAKNLLRNGYDGIIMPVNPREKAIEGVLTYNSIKDLPITPDLAVICIPSSGIPEVVKQLGKRGTKSMVIISAGLGEGHGLQGKRIKDEVLKYAKKYNIHFIGPNCVGIIVPPLKLNASFSHVTPKAGKIAFISQSGAVVTSVCDWACKKNIGFSLVASMGDMINIDFASMLEYLSEDENTEVILMYIESIIDAKKFIKYARKASLKKPIIAIKPGRHKEAAAAAASHTGALAGVDAVYDAVFKRTGILRVYSLSELFSAVETNARNVKITGNRMCILTNGGGIGVLATDDLIDAGGQLATLEKKTIDNLNKVLPTTWSHGNPVDIIGDADETRYSNAFKHILKDKNVDSIFVLNCPVAITSSAESAKKIVAEYKSCKLKKKPALLTSWLGATEGQEARDYFDQNGIPTYNTPFNGITGFRHMLNFYNNKNNLKESKFPKLKVNKDKVAKLINKVIKEKREWLTEPEAKEVLDAYGIPVTKSFVVATVADAVEAAKKINDAVVVKINSPDITHKSDYGGVKLNLRTAEEVEVAATNMLKSFAKSHPKANILGFSVQQMIMKPKAYELILGVVDDHTFGPVMLFGAGGKAVEVINDKILALPPLNRNLAAQMIHEIRLYNQMKGYRDEPAVNFEKIEDCLVRLSQLVQDFPQIVELDINPLLSDHNGVIAVDGRVLVRKYPHKGNKFVIDIL